MLIGSLETSNLNLFYLIRTSQQNRANIHGILLLNIFY